jgi:hypothetical protein
MHVAIMRHFPIADNIILYNTILHMLHYTHYIVSHYIALHLPPSSWKTFSIPLLRMNADALSQRTPAVQYISTYRNKRERERG